MSWRTVVISKRAKLDYQLGYLVVRDDETTRICIDEMAVLIIENTAVSLTAYLLNELIKAKVKVIFCDEKRNPSSELMSYSGSHDSSKKIRLQMTWRDAAKKEVWTEIVKAKINNQALLLENISKEAYQLLISYRDEIEIGDVTNREGHAAKVYFNTIFGKSFSRSQDNAINAALNYGYSILLSLFNKEINSNGYLTQIGIFHDNYFNAFNLASDFMEPFRPLVDTKVFYMGPEKFEAEEKHNLLHLLKEIVIIGGKQETIPNAIRKYTRSVLDAINEGDVSKILFYSLL